MALGDPFDATLKAAQERSQGIERGFGVLGESAQQFGMQAYKGQQLKEQEKYKADLEAAAVQKQREQLMPLLEKAGVYKTIEEQPTIDDWKKHAQDKFGVDLKVAADMPEDKQLKTINLMAQAMGVTPPPTRKRTEFDIQKAAELGYAEGSKGEVTIAPKKVDPSLVDQMAEYDEFLEYKKSHPEAKDLTYGGFKKGLLERGASGGMGAASVALAEKNAPAIANAIERGDYIQYNSAPAQTRATVDRILEERRQSGKSDVDITQESFKYEGQKQILKNIQTADSKVNLGISLRDAIEKNTDPETGDIKIPPFMHTEVALGVAKLLSPTGVVPIELEEQLRQGTLREKGANLAIYFGIDPQEVGGTTQSVARYFGETINRLASQAEQQRETSIGGGRRSFINRNDIGRTITDSAGLTGKNTGTLSTPSGKPFTYKKIGE